MKTVPIKQELQDFPFPLLGIGELNDRKLNRKLPLDLFLRHHGHNITINGKTYILSIPNSPEFPRDTLKLNISTWGDNISPGASHYYGHLQLPSLNFRDCETYSVPDRNGVPKAPRKVVLHRRLPEKELSRNFMRYQGYQSGDFIPGFNTLDGVVRRARVIAKEHFPGFKLEISPMKHKY